MPPDTCPFCEIAAGRGEGRIVYEDDLSVAFLDRRPLFPGHSLLVPRDHHETLADLPGSVVGPFFSSLQLLAGAVQRGMDAEGSFVAINNRVSQSVPHLHVHVVPRRRKDGLRGFFWPRRKYRDEAELEDAQASITRALRELARDQPSA